MFSVLYVNLIFWIQNRKFKRDWTESDKFQNDDFIKRQFLTLNVKERISRDVLVYGIIEKGLFSIGAKLFDKFYL